MLLQMCKILLCNVHVYNKYPKCVSSSTSACVWRDLFVNNVGQICPIENLSWLTLVGHFLGIVRFPKLNTYHAHQHKNALLAQSCYTQDTFCFTFRFSCYTHECIKTCAACSLARLMGLNSRQHQCCMGKEDTLHWRCLYKNRKWSHSDLSKQSRLAKVLFNATETKVLTLIQYLLQKSSQLKRNIILSYLYKRFEV